MLLIQIVIRKITILIRITAQRAVDSCLLNLLNTIVLQESGGQGSELKELRERCSVLEGSNKDFDMQMDLALARKNTEIKVQLE